MNNKAIFDGDEEVIKVYDPRTGEEIPTDQFAIRLTKREQVRYARTLATIFAKNAYIGKADINRLLLQFTTDPNLLTQEEIEYFRGVPEPPKLVANIPESSQPSKEAKENDTAIKRPKRKERRS